MGSKDDKRIMAIARTALFGDDSCRFHERSGPDRFFEGYSPIEVYDYSEAIAREHFFHRRGDLEVDSSRKQPIPVMVINNPHTNQVYFFKRASSKENYSESRLAGKWTACVGGHIDIEDMFESSTSSNVLSGAEILERARRRELEEEVDMDGRVEEVRLAGFINYEGTEVDRVHFALVYAVSTDSGMVKPRDKEMDEGRLMTYQEIGELVSLSRNPSSGVVMEHWARIVCENMDRILGRQI